MGLNQIILDIIAEPRIKAISFGQEGAVTSLELYPASPTQPVVQGASIIGSNDMPPDDVMLFASSPAFDDIVEAAKE